MVNRVLIISPHFPPINAPDHQRVRMSLPYLAQFGWEAHILTVRPDSVEGINDPLLEKTVPQEIPVTSTGALPIQQTRKFGLGSLGLRSFPYLLQAGNRLLQQQKFDLLYFSTTIFNSMALGPIWQRRFGIPYVLDFQDPWLSDYYEKPNAGRPPGGRLKYEFSQLQAKLLEPITLSSVSHVISVSPAYPQILQQRYPQLRPEQFTVLPFGAPEQDFASLPAIEVQQKIFNPHDGKRHWVYVGRGGDDMALALRALFLSIQCDRRQNPQVWESVRLHFIGTSYAPKELALKTVEPIAQELGIADLVSEHPERIPYFEALKVLTDSDAILLIGSNDSTYTASKLYPCILARKPILAIFHHQSSVIDILKQCQAGEYITFNSHSQPENLLTQVTTAVHKLLSLPNGYIPETNWSAFKPYTAKEMTRKQCQIFDQCLTSHGQSKSP
ncbi:glycosyltransferase [Anabaena azotica]|uniref:Glycosyltransferase n=1 Tax=Anabaena azotica FACHB-119 TaxID=947527 RepID=A0ABR8D3M6_9NOST|nr:glycosyltransferase [Anabaena azotica]MBD2501507.1 glycosyltransferase [Anabaena azotica FACHB-119]